MPLENEGGAGTAGGHWEKKVVRSDIMVPDTVKSPLFSKFTANLMLDSNWYTLNITKFLETNFGRNAGCSFFTKPCVTSNTTTRTRRFLETFRKRYLATTFTVNF